MLQIVLVGAENYTLMQVAYGHITCAMRFIISILGGLIIILEVFGMLWVTRKHLCSFGGWDSNCSNAYIT